MDRRKFIESAGRWGILGILAGITAILIRRNEISFEGKCNPKFCSSCAKNTTCKDAKGNTSTDAKGNTSTDAKFCVSTSNKSQSPETP